MGNPVLRSAVLNSEEERFRLHVERSGAVTGTSLVPPQGTSSCTQVSDRDTSPALPFELTGRIERDGSFLRMRAEQRYREGPATLWLATIVQTGEHCQLRDGEWSGACTGSFRGERLWQVPKPLVDEVPTVQRFSHGFILTLVSPT